MSVNKLLNISARSLKVYQQALTVTSHNIANVSNENYSRQRVTFTSDTPDYLQGFTIGSGVKIDDINRIKNNLLDLQIIEYNKLNSYAEERSQMLGTVEALYSEPSELGMSNLLNDFFDSWDKLSSDPSSIPLRDEVVNSAQKFSSKLQSVYEGYNRVSNDIKSNAEQTVTRINLILESVHNLNEQIYKNTVVGRNANDLMDERDAAIVELSQYVNLNVNYDEFGVATVSIGNSFAADRKFHNSYELIDDGGQLKLQSGDPPVDVSILGGELGAVKDLYGSVIPDHKTRLDELANSLMTEINSIHSAGYSAHTTPLTGIDFFESYGTGVLKINPNILDDPNYISVSANGDIGNNEVALQVSALKDSKVLNGLTLSENYSKLVSDLANDKVLNEQNSKSYSLVLDQMNTQKAEYSGVSVDEEMIDILKFQQSFDASAKLIQVADEIMQTLIQLV